MLYNGTYIILYQLLNETNVCMMIDNMFIIRMLNRPFELMIQRKNLTFLTSKMHVSQFGFSTVKMISLRHETSNFLMIIRHWVSPVSRSVITLENE